MTKFENSHKILTAKAFEIYSDSDLIIASDGELFAVYTAGGISDYNLMRGGMNEDELNAYIESFDDN